MKIILILILSLVVVQLKANPWFDSVGYRYYHDMDNERDGSKFRSYATKKLSNNNKLKIGMFLNGLLGPSINPSPPYTR